MSGSILYPLNRLKESHPEIYAEHVKKYVDREHLLGREVPTLNCLWNDVLHMTAVHPAELREAFAKVNYEIKNYEWFKIPISSLNQKLLTVYLYGVNQTNRLSVEANEFVDFNATKLDEYKKIPEETIEYYRQQLAVGKNPLMFHRVAHILYKGEIETKNLEIVMPYDK